MKSKSPWYYRYRCPHCGTIHERWTAAPVKNGEERVCHACGLLYILRYVVRDGQLYGGAYG